MRANRGSIGRGGGGGLRGSTRQKFSKLRLSKPISSLFIFYEKIMSLKNTQYHKNKRTNNIKGNIFCANKNFWQGKNYLFCVFVFFMLYMLFYSFLCFFVLFLHLKPSRKKVKQACNCLDNVNLIYHLGANL